MAEALTLFTGVVPFVHAAEARSFGRAAARLGVTTAAISKAVARLEADLGVRLLERTSRQVSLTPEGAAFLERCRDAVAAVQGAREAAAAARAQPSGELAVSLSPIVAPFVMPRLPALAARYPKLAFRLHVTDRPARLVEEQLDVAVRVGPLSPSTLMARRLRRTRWVTVAAPAYLARRPPPGRPADLAGHNCLQFVLPSGRAREWAFAGEPVKVAGNLTADSGEALVAAAEAGQGVVQALDFMVEARLRDGRLVELLAAHATEGPPVTALSPPGRARAPGVRAFVAMLVDAMAVTA
jgi:DNA-binding transcriptional LysR family regulator